METAEDLIHKLPEHVESFLTKWSEGMDKAGYLKYTTAKREDCILSFDYFLDPLMRHIEAHGEIKPFGDLLTPDTDWIDPFIQVARRHLRRDHSGRKPAGSCASRVDWAGRRRK